MLLFIDSFNQIVERLCCFNTSHVTLYLTVKAGVSASPTFQYISCYSLSQPVPEQAEVIKSFNTSHVTLYQATEILSQQTYYVFQYISCYSLSQPVPEQAEVIKSFNTSHVTLYLFARIIILSWTVVSIHLMLLFIVL